MLGVLCARPRPWLSISLSYAHGLAAAPFDRLIRSLPHPVLGGVDRVNCTRGASSIWHAILPSSWRRRAAVFSRRNHEGEGSWNVAWDARPARWLHHPNSAWMLFGLSAGSLIESEPDSTGSEVLPVKSDVKDSNSSNYRITGVAADGRCLFRAIAHMACLRNGEKAPDENRQRELADELRAQVVEELLKRRKELEWTFEEDFDVYVKRIQQPYVWGGEPELIMSSHVLRTPISVFTKERTSGRLIEIASYGEEYQKDVENRINVLFHGYGHYEILECILDSSEKVVA